MPTGVFLFFTALLAISFAYPEGTTGETASERLPVSEGSPAAENMTSLRDEVNLLKHWEGKVVVVTGASSGIGAAVSKNLVKSGLTVVGLARTKAKLEAIEKSLVGAKGKFYPLEADVSNEVDVKNAFGWIKTNLGNVDALVNNAGGAVMGNIIDLDGSDYKTAFDTNVLGLLYCTKEAFKIMKEKKTEGTIININSVLGHRTHNIPGLELNVYPATKFAVTAITETLQYEMANAGLNIRITSVSPGAVTTHFLRPTGPDGAVDKSYPSLQAESIADAIAYVLSVPQSVQISELTIKPLGQKV
ncbi:farnesol dehydrogenase-like [Athalia rosae]|uniref:farnesol dehydrogenase-like n=1 Tax=Athalia rosae TaxID=37344 RepID=UPI0020346D8E|nr:farnesol dehydrogenase-like [Athalia rosae]